MNQVYDNIGRTKPKAKGWDLEPLATYLESRFGNIYERDDGTWTPELKAAVTNYLLALPDDDYAAFAAELFSEVPDSSRAAQAAVIIEHHLPWRVAETFHIVAVKAVSTFQQLMESLSAVWDYEDWKSDARYWLEAHATNEQLRTLRSASACLRCSYHSNKQASGTKTSPITSRIP